MEEVLSVKGLQKTFKVGFWGRKVVACRDISFSIRRGEVYGVVGPNGAGKSTTLKMLLGFVRPDGGTGHLMGLPLGSRQARARLGYLPELPSFPRYLTAREVLDFHARLAGVTGAGWESRRTTLLERVGLARAANFRLSQYSKGMLQRCGLAVALCADPELLVLDEPMSGLDPLGRHDVRTLIQEQKAQGKTVVFSSHVLSDVEALCDSMAIISQGAVYKAGSLAEMTGGTVRAVEIQLHNLGTDGAQALSALGTLRSVGPAHLLDIKDVQRVEEALGLALKHGARVASVTPRTDKLEDILLQAGAQQQVDGRISP
ncbi:MAG: ABC transporter ATP-binding protein [Myxococcota bacterium]